LFKNHGTFNRFGFGWRITEVGKAGYSVEKEKKRVYALGNF
jgi:hypothetical protein